MVKDNIFGVEFLAQVSSVHGGLCLIWVPSKRNLFLHFEAQNPCVFLFFTSSGKNVNLGKTCEFFFLIIYLYFQNSRVSFYFFFFPLYPKQIALRYLPGSLRGGVMALRLSHHLCTSCCVLALMNVQPNTNPGKQRVRSSVNASIFVK